MTPAEEMERLAARARDASRAMSRAAAQAKTRALTGLADLLAAREEDVLEANRRDLEAALAPLPWLRCNRLEALRDGPSYTWDTLQAYRAAEPDTDFYFLLGSPDFALLPTWRRGLELPRVCHFVVVPRGDLTPQQFTDMTRTLWPAARPHPSPLPGGLCMALPGGGLAHFLPLPWLDVSSSRIRELWLAGRSVDYLMPEAALNLLQTHRQSIAACWQET